MSASTSPDDLVADFAFQCPRVACRRIFVGEYGCEDGRMTLLAVGESLSRHAEPAGTF